MTQDVRKYCNKMWETGAGITHEEEINMELDNPFMNKWAVIKMKCLWYWQLKAIISEWPNQVPAGIGNNMSNYDVSLLLASAHTLELGDTSSDGIVGFNDMQHVDGDGDDTGSKEGSTKCKVTVLEEAKPVITPKKTAPQKGKSTPATATQSASKKSKTGANRMNAVSVKEEETTQKLGELKKTKVRAETEKQVAKVRAKADVKMQADKLKADIAVKKMEIQAEDGSPGAYRP
ncbi:hypothetical protein L208DRAFT_1253789 [Tricholoma matsutake]|nr:hypothetical protein L208DRAFT_1253789 [Tricholoma matsutake 945]